jgi:rhamnogalacturonan endolyase
MKFFRFAIVTLLLLLASLFSIKATPVVTVSENGGFFTLDNGIVSARIAKNSGDLISLTYKNLEMLDTKSGRAVAYWSHNASHGQVSSQITINPKANGGERGEVSIQGISGGKPMGSGPGGSVVADIEIRYALNRGDSGIYTYCVFSHPANYPATSIGEARFCLKLNDSIFDWMTVDANRNMKMISAYDWNHGTQMNGKEMRLMNTGILKGQVEHKYDYSANQFDVRAWGWSSTSKNVSLWLVNPSVEYLSGGPTKFELSSHRDATFNTNALNAPAPPTLLNYWRSSHYGGSLCNIGQNDSWTKVIGPFLIYCNSGNSPDAMWKNALARSEQESQIWPFDWVRGVDYPHKNQRATITGKIILDDPQASGTPMKNLMVGLTAPDYVAAYVPRPPRQGRGGAQSQRSHDDGGFGLAGGGDDEAAMTNLNSSASISTNENPTRANSKILATNNPSNRPPRSGGETPRIVDWQTDARNYQFWVRANDDGSFSIPNVRPGTYSLHAIADGVLGELTVSNITVTSGNNLALGKLNWQPVRHGRQLWDIGIPNRKGSEFFKGDDYFHWGWYLQYPKFFPLDVNFVIGQSDFHKDWFFEQVPYNTNSNNVTGGGRGDATTWAVLFNLTNAPRGKATLRLALCGIGTKTLWVDMNRTNIATFNNLAYNATVNRDGIGGTWSERNVTFDASMMKAGTNTLELTIPAGSLMSGIIYDYLRLELDENAPASK